MLTLLLAGCEGSQAGDGTPSDGPTVSVNPGPAEGGPLDAGSPADASWANGGEDVPEYSLGRLLISRGDAAELALLDLDTGEVAARLPFARRASVHTGTSGRYGYVSSPESGQLRIVDPGHWLLSHIDHFHVMRGAPKLFDAQVELGALTSFSAHDGWIALYDAQRARSVVFQERSLSAGTFMPQIASLGGAVPQGIAIVSHTQWFVGESGPSGSAQLSERSATDAAIPSTRIDGCTAPIAAGAHEGLVFVGCTEGLLHLTFDPAQKRFVASMTTLGQGERVTRIGTAHRFPGALAQVAPNTLLVTNAQTGALRRASFPSTVIQLAVRRQGTSALVLTQDGALHELSLDSVEITRTVPVLGPQPELAEARPRLVLSHAYAYVSDPQAPRIVTVRLKTLAIEAELKLDGPALDVALVGLPETYTDYRE